ncbi:Sialic acid TRAP transporter permease protein SiaT [Pseudovibrio sp. W64]|uniref:TRAP transporter large permease n=1 Tax=unclassified Pseudovibrio TaxID=2627060 RepID=UPI0007AE85B8|nr:MULTISPECIES: TRAP transporter large permease subunit [unclassified Pseudovibrio]KZK87769.1 Sialic acid TRAP transporter permease protein SiaT [Pseudovibrio sp. W64]KZL03640.1 Sialic acid TRAP transporter permease protein SiaT [Pseudovibrio sp. W74]KZL09646.1 Sialic acid TRAP transporter permease protein SiaT [Pseudovibrio sp. Ad14]
MTAFLILAALLLLLVLRVPVAFALGSLGVFLLWYFPLPLNAVPQRLYGSMDSFELLAVPMFLLMSNVLLKGGVGKDLFAAVQSWVGHWPGGLGVATILSCGLFSAVSGSSVATAATIATVAIPEMTSRGYERPFVLGMLAAGGTLGILIPPSIPLILYGIVTESSIPKLFLAGIGPGLFLASVFIIYGMLYSRFNSNYERIEKASWAERRRATFMALPTVLLAGSIIGSIYMGIATPSESAGIGFVMALLITFVMGRMNWEKMKEATYKSMKTTTMVFLIIAGAKVFSYAITLYRLPQDISTLLTTNISEPGLFILAVGLVLLIVGFFLESLSMLLIMVPVLFPALVGMSIDPIWFGIFFVVLIETALITPPVGMNLFIIQAVGGAKLSEVAKGAWPFALMMLATAALLYFWQGLALYIPYNT